MGDLIFCESFVSVAFLKQFELPKHTKKFFFIQNITADNRGLRLRWN